MRQQAELGDALKLYRTMASRETAAPEKSRSAPSAVWAAWLLLAIVLAAFAVWSSGPLGYEFIVDTSNTPPPELIGP
ncbi:MAG TPA: hypothetical protein VMU42_09645 [Candidatus Sulfotelmatobacter sp.]|nr:hypothetical protein [Candidatus Sulfotelmatobacter sp.]